MDSDVITDQEAESIPRIGPDNLYERYYHHTFGCRNCGTACKRYIRKGVPVDRITILCGNCGCIIHGVPRTL